jgi:hypothetical protein
MSLRAQRSNLSYSEINCIPEGMLHDRRPGGLLAVTGFQE